jgi:putative aldouronate transport system substrate-binding protein
VTGYDRLMKDDTVKKWKGANPNADWVMVKDVKGPADTYAEMDYASARAYVSIAKGVEENPEKLNRIFEFANYVAKGDGLNLVHFGLKDVHYTVDGGKVTPTAKMSEAEYVWIYQIGDRVQKDFLSGKYPNLKPYIDYLDQVKLIKTYNGLVTAPPGFNLADANRFKDEELLKFFYGKTKMDQYSKFLNTLDTTFQYKMYIDTAMKQFKEQGIIK